MGAGTSSGEESSSGPPTAERPTRQISRRGFIVGSAAGVAGIGLAGYSGLAIARDDLRPGLDPSTGTGRLSEGERTTLHALAQVLVPDEVRVERFRILALLDRATETEPGLLAEYRSGADTLDVLAAARGLGAFAQLDLADRDRVLDAVFWRYPADYQGGRGDIRSKVLRRLERVRNSTEVRRLRQLVVRDLLRRMYVEGIPLLIGYSNLPGVPGDPREYTGPPAGHPDEAPSMTELRLGTP